MKIILDGVDCSGKTTLANILADKYGLDVCHCTQHDPADFEFYKNSARKENVVWDRHTIGEMIYPNIFNRERQLGIEDVRIVLHHFRKTGGKVFVLTADPAVLQERLSERPNEHRKIKEKILEIDQEFRWYADLYRVPIIDTSKMLLKEIFELIERDDHNEKKYL